MMAAFAQSAVAAFAQPATRVISLQPAIAAKLVSLSAAWSAESKAAWTVELTPSAADTLEPAPDAARQDARALLKEAIPITRLISSLTSSQVTLLGAVVNVLLAVVKLVVGTLSGSAALLADAYHSASDLMVDGVTLLAVHGSPDIERACTLIIAVLLSSGGAAMVYESMGTLFAATMAATPAEAAFPFGAVGPFAVATLAIAAKELLFRITRQVALRMRSAVLLASANHHRSDALSSLAAALGTCGVLVGLPMADAIAAATVGVMLIHMGTVVARGDH